MSNIKYISLEKANSWEKLMGFLSNYILPQSEHHRIGNEENTNFIATKKLHELGEINAKRLALLQWFKEEKGNNKFDIEPIGPDCFRDYKNKNLTKPENEE